jgi:SAM-dependent MidA family methyltransferase
MSQDLTQLIQARIRQKNDWIPFDDFMDQALYAPGLGYYAHGGRTFGHMPQDGSDFVTAPELSALFGRALGRQVAQALVATNTSTVWEFGAGSGALAEQLLASDAARHLKHYAIVEISSSLMQVQRERLQRFGNRVQWHTRLPDKFRGVVLGNEVLDAMPVKLLRFDGNQWLERGVVNQADGFGWEDRPTDLRPPYEHGQWVPGVVTEVHPQARAWVSTVAERLARGALFLIDYGFPDVEYYHPQRIGGTLMCHHQHRSDPNPLVLVGQKDITAHVNFTSIALTGQDAGLHVLGFTSQAHFLLNCGIAHDLQAAGPRERSLGQRLINEHEMGELFKVVGFCHPDHPFEALGFESGDRSHRL